MLLCVSKSHYFKSYSRTFLLLNLYLYINLMWTETTRCRVLMYLCVWVFFFQLPHMPHISECLMKRSLKPTDLRDMTLGQLQVIVNDLHSQIESEFKTHTSHWPLLRIAEMSKRAYGEKHAYAYWPLPFTVDVKVLLYMLVQRTIPVNSFPWAFTVTAVYRSLILVLRAE